MRYTNVLKMLLPYLAGLFAGLIFISSTATGYGLEFFPGDLADARFNNYLLEHDFRFFTGTDNAFWDAGYMYPETKVITYSDNLVGTAPFYAIFRLVGIDRETSFQLWYVLMCILNYSAAYFFIRYLIKDNYAAACGAFVFAFSLALNSQLGHAQTFPRFMVPVTLWLGILFMKELRPKHFFFTLLCLVYQFYCGIYLGFLLAVPFGLVMVFTMIYKRKLLRIKMRDKRWWSMMTGAAVIAILLLIPIMLPYYMRSRQIGLWTYEMISQSLPTVISYLYSPPGTLFWQFNQNLGVAYPAFWDHQIFAGGVTIICCLIFLIFAVRKLFMRRSGISLRIDQPLQVMLLTGIVTFLFFIKFGEFSFYKILFHLPGFGSLRALQRIINIELLFFGIGVAFVIAEFQRKVGKLKPLFFGLLLILMIYDNRLNPEHVHKELKSVAYERLNNLLVKVDVRDPETVLCYEPDTVVEKQIYFQLDGMMAAQSLGIRTMNGYSATAPFGYDAYWRLPNEASRKWWQSIRKFPDDHLQVVK